MKELFQTIQERIETIRATTFFKDTMARISIIYNTLNEDFSVRESKQRATEDTFLRVAINNQIWVLLFIHYKGSTYIAAYPQNTTDLEWYAYTNEIKPEQEKQTIKKELETLLTQDKRVRNFFTLFLNKTKAC